MGLRDIIIPVVGIVILIVGVAYTFQYPGMMGPPVLSMVGGFVTFLGWVQIVGVVNRSGLGPLVYQRLGPRDDLLMWISGSGKVYPIIAKETVYEKYITLPFVGRLRVPKGSMMVLPTGRKIGIAMAGISHVIPPQQVRVVMEFRKLGFKDFRDVEIFVKNYPLFRKWLESLTKEEKNAIKDNNYLFLEDLKRMEGEAKGGGENETETSVEEK
jgi:hypothetical protein